MKKHIHILGASGSGTTTLAKVLSDELGYAHFDSDDYFWIPTEPPFTTKRPLDERVENRMVQRLAMFPICILFQSIEEKGLHQISLTRLSDMGRVLEC